MDTERPQHVNVFFTGGGAVSSVLAMNAHATEYWCLAQGWGQSSAPNWDKDISASANGFELRLHVPHPEFPKTPVADYDATLAPITGQVELVNPDCRAGVAAKLTYQNNLGVGLEQTAQRFESSLSTAATITLDFLSFPIPWTVDQPPGVYMLPSQPLQQAHDIHRRTARFLVKTTTQCYGRIHVHGWTLGPLYDDSEATFDVFGHITHSYRLYDE